MLMRYKKWSKLMAVSMCFLAATHAAFASGWDNATRQAESQISMLKGYLGGKEQINSHIFIPMTSGGRTPMLTVDRRRMFRASISKPGDKRLIDIFIQPGQTGDLSVLRVYQRIDSPNSYDYEYTVPFNVSGICANGVISCQPGTWKKCRYFIWTADEKGRVSLSERPPQDLGGCYCINKSCGYELASRNLSIILKDLAGGVLAAEAEQVKIIVSSFQTDSSNIVYYGDRDDTKTFPDYANSESPYTDYEWQSGVSNPEKLYNPQNGALIMNAAAVEEESEKANSSSLYSLLADSQAAKSSPFEEHTCYIKRVVDVVKHQNSYYSAEGNNTCPERFNTSMCSKIDRCYTDGQGNEHCLCYLKATGGGVYGCGESYSYSFCGKFTTGGSIPDDACVRLKVGGNTVWAAGPCDTTGGTDYWSGKKTASTNGVQSVWAAYANLGACNGSPSSYFYVYIYRKAWDEVNEYVDNQCKEYENNPNCPLKNEWVDGVQTWKDYAVTGLLPVGDVCKTFYGWTSHTVCYDWWQKRRVYTCRTSSYDFSKTKKRMETIIGSTKNADINKSELGSVSYSDYRKKGSGWITENKNLSIPFGKSSSDCMQVCKVRVPVSDTQATGNENTSMHRSTSSYVFDYRKCSKINGKYTCPYSQANNEVLVKSCQCINEFPEAAAIMNTLEHAGKDIICSSGTKH